MCCLNVQQFRKRRSVKLNRETLGLHVDPLNEFVHAFPVKPYGASPAKRVLNLESLEAAEEGHQGSTVRHEIADGLHDGLLKVICGNSGTPALPIRLCRSIVSIDPSALGRHV